MSHFLKLDLSSTKLQIKLKQERGIVKVENAYLTKPLTVEPEYT